MAALMSNSGSSCSLLMSHMSVSLLGKNTYAKIKNINLSLEANGYATLTNCITNLKIKIASLEYTKILSSCKQCTVYKIILKPITTLTNYNTGNIIYNLLIKCSS